MKTTLAFFFLSFFIIPLSESSTPNQDIKTIKQRVVTTIMKPAVDDEQVELLLKSISEDGTWPGINYEDVSRTGFEHRFHYGNMIDLLTK